MALATGSHPKVSTRSHNRYRKTCSSLGRTTLQHPEPASGAGQPMRPIQKTGAEIHQDHAWGPRPVRDYINRVIADWPNTLPTPSDPRHEHDADGRIHPTQSGADCLIQPQILCSSINRLRSQHKPGATPTRNNRHANKEDTPQT